MEIIDRPTVVKFCTNCSASNELDATKCGNCMKELVEGLDDYLKGVSAVLLGDSEDPVLPAKELVDFLKENPDSIEAKAINLDGEIIKGEKLKDVAKMPGRQELIASIVSIAMGPAGNLVSVIKGPASTIAGQLKALEEKLEN